MPRPSSRLVHVVPLVHAVVATACTGTIGVGVESDPVADLPGGAGRPASGAGGAGVSARPPTHEPVVGQTPLARLSSVEWARTLEDAWPEVGVAIPRGDLPVDDRVAGFAGQSRRALGADDLLRYVQVAETVAQAAAARPAAVFGACIEGGDAQGCLRARLAERLPRLWRRPVDASELDAIVTGTFAPARAAHGLPLALEATVLRVLLSPHFLYKVERTTADDAGARLDDAALAARLSYFLWKSAPDEPLRALAQDGRLADPDVLAREARRLLDHPRGQATLRDFGRQWLHLDEAQFPGKSAYPEFGAALKAQMFEETDRFLDHLVRQGGGPWTDLFTARYSFATPALAALYGVPGGSPEFGRVELAAAPERAGLLTHASFLAQHSHYDDARQAIHRGLTVRTQLLCQSVPAPENVDTSAQVDRLVPGNGCSGCHLQFETIGLAFERFDGIGRHRPGAPEPRGLLRDLDGADHPLSGVRALGELLAGSTDARTCVAQQVFRFAYGREDAPEEAAVLDAAAALAPSGDLRAVIERLVRAPAFRQRRVAAVTSACTP